MKKFFWKRVIVKLKKMRLFTPLFLNKVRKESIQQIFNKEYDAVVVFENHFGYYNIMLQRPQHLTRNLADAKTLVLYNSYYDVDYHDSLRIKSLKEDFYILDFSYYRNEIMKNIQRKQLQKYLMIYSTDMISLKVIQNYQRLSFKVIYEYVDDINPDLIFQKNYSKVKNRHDYLLSCESVYTIATATRLYENVLEKTNRVTLVTNGVECENFVHAKQTSDHRYLDWIKDDKIKVGYYGALANWMNYELLKYVARDPKIQIILIGVEHDQSLKNSGLLSYDNVLYVGQVAYKELPGYAKCFDICMIPFLLNDITRATSPVKLFEYMSMGKPVISTALPECKKYDVVAIADSNEQFLSMLYQLNDTKENKEYIEKRIVCAYENSWENKAKQIKEYLGL